MNVNHLIFFCALASTRNFSLAAEQCATTQPNLSYGIKTLEDELGVRLFSRDKKGVALTSAGQIYLHHASTTLKALQAGENALRDFKQKENRQRSIRIGGRRLNYFADILSRFFSVEEYGKLTYEAHVYSVEEMQAKLLTGDIDLGTCPLPENCDRSGILYLPIKLPDLVLVVDAQHPLADKQEIDLRQTEPYHFICKAGSGSLNQEIDALFRKVDFAPKVSSWVGTQDLIVNMVENRAGIALVADTRSIDAYNVRKIRIHYPKQDFYYAICFRKQGEMHAAARLLCQYIVQENGVNPDHSLQLLYPNTGGPTTQLSLLQTLDLQ